MNGLILRLVFSVEEKNIFTAEVQEAFQKAYEDEFGKFEKQVLPMRDIEASFAAQGAEVYFAEIAGKRVGGAVVVINAETGCNSLHLLYVNPAFQNAGNGFKIWKLLEELHPETKVWETHTPYFDKRNIHFYVNLCGFKIVEFFNPKHQDPYELNETAGNIPPENNCFFRFEKEMK